MFCIMTSEIIRVCLIFRYEVSKNEENCYIAK